MSTENPFVKPLDQYGRDLNILDTAISDAAHYLATQEGISIEEATEFVKGYINPKTGAHPVTDPPTKVLVRDQKKGRQPAVIPFSKFLSDIEDNNFLMAPTLTNYTHPHERRSILSEYIDGNIQKRKVVKKAGQRAKAEGNLADAAIKHVLQSTFKIKNNSISGAHSNPHNSLYLKSAHPTLTSTCRSATSYSNANTERFLMGNRHYRNAEVTLNNIVSVVQLADYDLIEAAMEAYQLHFPSPEEVFKAVRRSADMYWKCEEQLMAIKEYIEKLTPIQRAAYLYTQDMYHLAQYNRDQVHGFITALAIKAQEPVDNPKDWLDMMDADITALVSLVCAEELKGTTLWNCAEEKPEAYKLLGAHVKKVIKAIEQYSLLIRAFWCTNSPPPEMGHFNTSIRKAVIVSDTDSTIFTTQDWVRWYYDGDLRFDEQSNAIAATIVFITSQTTVHLLAQMSGGMGVAPEHIHKLEMKNEFFFPILSLTTKAKHYYSWISACEGNVYDEMEAEYKGVSLKNSKIPKEIMNRFNKFTEDIMDTVLEGKKISIRQKLEEVWAIEKEITDSLLGGHTDHLTLNAIRSIDSYKNPGSSPYQHYLLWQEVFAPKYGGANEPPYGGRKINLRLPNPTALRLWIERMEDQELAQRIQTYVEKHKRKDLQYLILPMDIVEVNGVPKELLDVADVRKVCVGLLEPFILVLESLGLYMKNKDNTRLPSDFLHDLPAMLV